jgi:hypothetical protein
VSLAYDAIVALGGGPGLEAHARQLREQFQRRTGAFGPEDAWFETRTRAFWDDALTAHALGLHVAEQLSAADREMASCFARAHRGLFLVDDADETGAHLVDVWSGAELLVRHLDETQAMTLTLADAEAAIDARVTSAPGSSELFVLPGAYHHPADAAPHAMAVLAAAREKGLSTTDALDALLRMELVFRTSSRVKAAFAYRPEGLRRPAADDEV